MAEIQNENTQINSSDVMDVNELQSLTIQDIVSIVIYRWYWFVISVALCLGVGALYLMRTAPIYQRTATILVKDSRKGSGMNEMAAFSDLAGFATRRNVDNELFVIQARRLMVEVVAQLGLETNYTIKKGLRTVPLYKNSPIAVTFLNDSESSVVCSFKVEIKENGFEIFNYVRPKTSGVDPNADKELRFAGNWGDTVILPNCEVIVESTIYNDSSYEGKVVNVSKANRDMVASRYCQAVNSTVANKMSSIINLSYKDTSAKRAEDILNTLISVYNNDAVIDKQQIAEATAEFIDERLAIISKELGSVDGDIKRFKESNNMTDIKTDVNQTMLENSKLRSEGLSVDSQIEMAKFIKDYLNDSAKDYSLIPIANLEGQNTSSMIKDYNELILRREKLVQNGSENNPAVQQLDNMRVSLKSAILASLESNIETLKIKLDNIRREEHKATTRISSVPRQEQDYLSIARQQKIKEELYLYLLNKREENAISLAITENTARVIDSAFGPYNPVAPRREMILLIAFLLGCGIPFAIFYLREVMDTTVRSRQDIEKYTHIPYLGDVPVFDGKAHRGIAVSANGRDSVSEAFRIIRTNMGFMNTNGSMKVLMVTSSNAHAGKTFITTNLAMTLAFSKNKVLVIDLDLRRRTLSKHMGQKNNPLGVTKFITDPDVRVEDIVTSSDVHENISFVYAGLQPPNPAEMLLSTRIEELVNQARMQYDYVIIDSVPAMVIADALITSRLVDLSIYVVRSGLLDRRQLPDIDQLHKENKLNNMCVILNAATERSHRYGYGYGYGYGYTYHSYTSSDDDEIKLSRFEKIVRKLGMTRLLYKGHRHHRG